VGSVLVLNCWAVSSQGNSLSCHCCSTALYRQHSEHENNKINRLDKLGNTSHRRCGRAADIVGGP